MPKLLKTLPIGALVKDDSTRYLDKPIIWKIADKNHGGYPANSVTLIADKILSVKVFDGKEFYTKQSGDRAKEGNNRYDVSNINAWLNSDAGAGRWYKGAHYYDYPPSYNAIDSGNPYDGEAGFLYDFSVFFKSSLLTTTLTQPLDWPDVGSLGPDSMSMTTKVFLISRMEAGTADRPVGESKFPIFTDDASRCTTVTEECWHADLQGDDPGYAQGWHTRSPYLETNAYVIPGKDKTYNLSYACRREGIRPLCNISDSIRVSDEPGSDGVYAVLWNLPPTTPTTITVPSVVTGGKTLSVTWGGSTDADNNLSGYALERQNNGGTWSEIYRGIGRGFIDTIPGGWSSVAYRVKAYDAVGAVSEYKTSPTRAVINNTAPSINGSDGNLGTKAGPFSQSYIVTDSDSGQTITVVEKIDGVQKRSYTATSGQSNVFDVSAGEWVQLGNGNHTLTITATDNYGGTVTRTYLFVKNQTEIELTFAAPLPADDLVTKSIVNLTKCVPAGAALTVEVCNNGNDPEPTWEDVTEAVSNGKKFFFTNTTKVAAAWGYNLRIKLKRNGGIGDCFISSIGGNFE